MSNPKAVDLRAIATGSPSDRMKVALALRTAAPDESCLKRLSALGVSVDRVVGNKVLGSVKRADIPRVAADPEVIEVEEGRKLSLF